MIRVIDFFSLIRYSSHVISSSLFFLLFLRSCLYFVNGFNTSLILKRFLFNYLKLLKSLAEKICPA